MNIPKISQNVNMVNVGNTVSNLNNKVSRANVSFGANTAAVESKFFNFIKKPFKEIVRVYDKGTDVIANGLGRLLQKDFVYNAIEKSSKKKLLMNHLMTVGSTILSGFYVIRTLGNKDLEEKKKKTLAINQTLVFLLSTITCYTVDSWINSKVNTFANQFEAVNKKYILDEKKLVAYRKGVHPASKVLVFDTIFRFLAPVFLTPVANHLGNKLNDKKEAELAKQSLNKTA